MSRPTNDWAGQSVSQGRYLVRAQLGEGGMGFVYRALDRNLDSDVVIKVPRRAMLDDPEFASRFSREIRSLVKLAHPNIVKVTDVGEHDGVPFAVMQYLSGGSLEDYTSADRGPDAFRSGLAALGEWLPGIASALDFVHSQGYVHRDVKPGNILFDAHGHVFLSDFGVAKALAAEPEAAPRKNQTALTGAGMVLGTPEYMAPELIMGTPFDGRIDQYALAVTVYEMLGGRRPFEAASPTACMVMQTTQLPPPLWAVEPRVSRGLSDAVARALDKDPGRRYKDCAAFAAAVVAHLAGEATACGGHKTPSGRAVRPDQVRLHCPACDKSLVLPASVLSDPQKARGKRLSCPSCQAHLKISDDGRSLVIGGTSSSTGFHAAQTEPSGTRRVVSPRSATIPVARPASPQTVRQTPSPRPPILTKGVETTPAAEVGRTGKGNPVPAWAIGAGVTLLALAASLLLAITLVPKLGGLKSGRVLVDTTSVPAGATFVLDGRKAEPAEFDRFLDLPPGVHSLAVIKAGFEPYGLRFPVSPGENPAFKVVLTRLPTPPARLADGALAGVATKSAREEKGPGAKAGGVPPPPAPPEPVASVVAGRAPQAGPPPRPDLASRVERPAVPTGGFKPVPDGPPVDKHSLAEILGKPDTLSDRVVVPTGLYVLGPVRQDSESGTASTTVTRIAMHVRSNTLAFLQPTDPPVTVQVDHELATNLRPLANLRVAQPDNTAIGIWSASSAVLTFHVQQRLDGPTGEWVPVLKKIEFLVGVNFPRVGEGNFKDAFKTVTVSSSSLPSQGLSDRHDWKARLGVPYLVHLKRHFQSIKGVRFAQDMQSINNAMTPALNNMIRNNVTPATVLDARTRMGR